MSERHSFTCRAPIMTQPPQALDNEVPHWQQPFYDLLGHFWNQEAYHYKCLSIFVHALPSRSQLFHSRKINSCHATLLFSLFCTVSKGPFSRLSLRVA